MRSWIYYAVLVTCVVRVDFLAVVVGIYRLAIYSELLRFEAIFFHTSDNYVI